MKANHTVCFHHFTLYHQSMTLSYDLIPLADLLPAALRAADKLARFDERVARGPIGKGLLERLDFQDSAASLWNDGELVHIEDLVLHDAHMDIRTPTQEITDAHRILRARRHILSNPADWALSPRGLSLLLGSTTPQSTIETTPRPAATVAHDDGETLDAIDEAFLALDKILARSTDVLEKAQHSIPTGSGDPLGVFHDEEWDEQARLAQWQKLLEAQSHLPGILQSIIALDAWEQIEVSQRSPWLGRQLASAILRQSGVSIAHLACFNIGLKNLPRRQRIGLPMARRLKLLLGALEASAEHGLREHDKLTQAKARLERISAGRRSNSRLPDLIDLILTKPVISTSMIVDALGTTPQGAVGLAKQLEIRELTGRGRFRAWGII
jgi:hypothetical protein